MKILAAAAILGGVLLLVIPRFVFPACEYLGRGRMLLKSGTASILIVASAVLLCAAAFFVPAYTRYCANPEMACHYGLVPSVRFIAVAVGLVEAVALAGLVRDSGGAKA